MYKAKRSPEISEKFEYYEDTRKEAKDYNKHSIGIFKLSSKEGKKTLVGHIAVELSSLIDYFLMIEETNRVIAEVTGKRKREVGLVVPAKFTASTMNRQFAHVLHSELNSTTCIMCVQYIGGCSVHRGVFSTSGGYHEYIGGISWVHRGMFSTSRRYHDECGGIPWEHRGMFSTSEGYHEYIGRISWVHRGMFSTLEGYHDTCGGATW